MEKIVTYFIFWRFVTDDLEYASVVVTATATATRTRDELHRRWSSDAFFDTLQLRQLSGKFDAQATTRYLLVVVSAVLEQFSRLWTVVHFARNFTVNV